MNKLKIFRTVSRIIYISCLVIMILMALSDLYIPNYVVIVNWIGIVGFALVDFLIHVKNLLEKNKG